MHLNCDSNKIQNWEITPEGFMKLWVAVATANKDLVYNKDSGEVVTEFISKDKLLDKSSINSAVGKHVTFNHPPEAISANNWKQHAVGVALQEYANDGDSLLMATMIYDQDVIEKIKSGSIKYTSSSYSAVKQPTNSDGKIEQLARSYNHFALLGDGYAPRAGYDCSIRAFGLPNKDSTNMSTKESEELKATNQEPNPKEGFISSEALSELISLHTQYGEVLKSTGKAQNFNQDAISLKKEILSCYYPSEQIAKLNNDSLNGFWINFELNKELINMSRETSTSGINNDSLGGTETSSSRDIYIAKLENRPIGGK